MRVLVLGGGVIGVTTAYELLKDGHEVTLVEREAEVALGTSFANAGMVAPGHAFAWASPRAPKVLMRSLWRNDGDARWAENWCAPALSNLERARRRRPAVLVCARPPLRTPSYLWHAASTSERPPKARFVRCFSFETKPHVGTSPLLLQFHAHLWQIRRHRAVLCS